MKRMTIIWIIYILGILIAFFCPSCASQKPYTVKKQEPVRTEARKGKEMTLVNIHLMGLFMAGWIYHFMNEDSK